MIAEFEDESSDSYSSEPYRIYATGLEHKHVPEMQARWLSRSVVATSRRRPRRCSVATASISASSTAR